MGSPKALLRVPDGRTFVRAITETFAAAGISDMVVVTGRDHDRIVEALTDAQLPVPLLIARNPNPLSMRRRAIVPVGMTLSSDARRSLDFDCHSAVTRSGRSRSGRTYARTDRKAGPV